VEFLAVILSSFFDPIRLGLAIVVGYLLYAEMPKLAWGIFFFILPGAAAFAARNGHGSLFNSAAQFIAAGLIVLAIYWVLEFLKFRPSRRA
jgi:hypothetical protein